MRFILLAIFGIAFGSAAQAQTATVVSSCSTVTAPYVPGSARPITVDTNGNLCIDSGGSGTVTVAPSELTTNNLSGTISVTNTFQSIQVTTTRGGCTVQNPTTNTNPQWVFFGAIGSATKATAVQMLPGDSVSCAVGGTGVIKDQISIVGTSGDTFYAGVQ